MRTIVAKAVRKWINKECLNNLLELDMPVYDSVHHLWYVCLKYKNVPVGTVVLNDLAQVDVHNSPSLNDIVKEMTCQ